MTGGDYRIAGRTSTAIGLDRVAVRRNVLDLESHDIVATELVSFQRVAIG